MRFHPSDDQLALRDAVRRYLGDVCDGGVRRQAVEGDIAGAAELWRGCAELGLTGLVVPEEYGGLGLGLIDLALISDVFGYEAAPAPFLGHALATLAIAQGGSPGQKADLLPRLATGEVTAALAIGEGGEAWSPHAWRIDVEAGRIRGAKHFVTAATEADIAVVGTRGGALGVVDCRDPGVTAAPIRSLDMTRPLGTLEFDGTPVDPLPGADAERLFDALLVQLAADAHGAARRAIDMTVAYVLERQQFGRRIGSFQAVKHQLANITACLVPAEPLVWYAALADGSGPADRGFAAALAKAHLADRAMDTTRTCVELHGGIGYTWDYDLHIWLKRAMFDFSYANVPTVHRARAMALRRTARVEGPSLTGLL
ncbi:acyl-CoA dehydrogenase [Rhodobacterales bacterium HKCCE2091]|nr:acyl-CoA dehydrogenase [Rhodobacterales bacterium HKCCE2091]